MSRALTSNCLFGSNDFLAISSDNRLRLWDIVNNKEKRCFVEKQHLSHSYTCFAWGQDVETKGAGVLGFCAVGTSDGTIVVWDLTRGVVVRTIGTPGSSPAPTDIRFSHDLESIFACSSDSSIYEYSIKTGETKQALKGFKKGALRLAVNQKVLAVASGSVKLFNTDSGKKAKLDAAFSSGGVAAMAFSDCGHYLACAGEGAREVLVFCLQEAFGESDVAPLCVCAVSGPPTQLVVKVAAGGKRKAREVVDVLCILEGGEGCVLRVEASKKGGAELAQVPFSSPVLSVCFSPQVGSVLLATGALSAPRFVTLPYVDEAGSALDAVTLPSSEGSSDSRSNLSTEKVGAEVAVLGPHENGGLKRPVLSDEADPSAKRIKAGGSVDKLTVEERLNSAAASLLQLETLAEGAEGGAAAGAAVATSDSLVSLVEQALQAGDDGLMEQCLECPSKDVVAETSKRLPTRLVVPLLRKLVAKFEKKPSRGVLLTRWLHGLLRCHMSFLLAVPDLAHQLAALSQMLEQRLQTYSRLASLAGRLDLLMSQISAAPVPPSAASKGSQESIKSPKQIYYEE